MFGSHEFSSKRRLNTRGLQRWTILSRNVKKFCLREEYELTQYCLKPILTLSCSYLRVNFSQSFIHLPCIKFSSTRAEKRLHAFECRAK